MQTIVFATHNQNKLDEMKEIIKKIPGMENWNVISMTEAGITEEIVEDGDTYEENALIKARFVCQKTGLPVLADDSGTEIDALYGAPGIYSARFLGEDTPYSEKIVYIMKQMIGLPDTERHMKYVCCMAAAFPNGIYKTETGELHGLVAQQVSTGRFGFAYDPIMYIPELGKTMADIPMEEKNKISHRGKALRKICQHLVKK